MRTTKHKLGYRLVLCLVVLMLFFSDSSDEQALGFSACYNKLKLSPAKGSLHRVGKLDIYTVGIGSSLMVIKCEY